MTYSPYLADLDPPLPTESVSVFGMDNAVWRLSFLATYFGLCAFTLKSCQGCSFGQLLMLHLIWFFAACYVARDMNKLVCELVDEDKQRAHAKLVVAALAARPKSNRLEIDDRTGKYEQVPLDLPGRQPLREARAQRMIDPDMGVRPRP